MYLEEILLFLALEGMQVKSERFCYTFRRLAVKQNVTFIKSFLTFSDPTLVVINYTADCRLPECIVCFISAAPLLAGCNLLNL